MEKEGWRLDEKREGVMRSELGDEGSGKQVRVRGTEHRWRKGEEDGGMVKLSVEDTG